MFDNSKELRSENAMLLDEIERTREQHANDLIYISQLNMQMAKVSQQQDESKKMKRKIMELEEDIARKERRCQGLTEAVARWKRKVKKEPEPVLSVVISESKKINGKWEDTETWVLPVPADPLIWREARTWIEQQSWSDKVKRVYFHGKYGFVAVVTVEF